MAVRVGDLALESRMFNPMLNRKTAADHAAAHLKELIAIEGSPVVEEHFLTDGVWQITLSYIPSASVNGSGSAGKREFKSFVIDGRSGEVLSMKIRSLQG